MSEIIRTPEDYRLALRVLDDVMALRTAPAGHEPLIDQIAAAVRDYEARARQPANAGGARFMEAS
ncbi:MAG TPA: hypothetical protein VEB20_12960 [Azospirillaceae bacterium]|nr:hypothetical protein [Azospirillaceae bacterium]